MFIYNILGCCVSRDVFNLLIEQKEAQVLRYIWSNPISFFSKKPIEKIDENVLGSYDLNGFHKRNLRCDYNKETLDYIFSRKSDYLVIDTLNSRFRLLEKDGHTVSLSNPLFHDSVKREKLMLDFGLGDYKTISAYDISEKEWTTCFEKMIDEILLHYTADQIILFEFYGVERYLTKDKSGSRAFGSESVNQARCYNSLAKKLNEVLKSHIADIHVVEFPENVMAIQGHRLGTHPLHYMDEYYEYAAKAVEIITEKLSINEEKIKISELRDHYSKIFGLYKVRAESETNLSLTEKKRSWAINALNFSKAVALDALGDNIFGENLRRIKELGMKVIILRASDSAGVILQRGLDKYGIDTVMKTNKSNLSQLTPEELEAGKQPGTLIISANVHTPIPQEQCGLSVLWVNDLLEKDCAIPINSKADPK